MGILPTCPEPIPPLEGIDLGRMKHEEKYAFWSDVHSALVMHVKFYGLFAGKII